MKIDFSRMVTAEAAAAAQMAEAQAGAIAALAAWADEAAAQITGLVPLVERLSWGTKDAAARALLAGTADAAARALIGGEAAVTGTDPADLAKRIVRNADAYRAAVARLTALRIEAIGQVRQAKTPADVSDAVARAQAAWRAA